MVRMIHRNAAFVFAFLGCLSVAALAATLDETRAMAGKGDATAQLELGTIYKDGKRLPQDLAAAVSWWRKAAD